MGSLSLGSVASSVASQLLKEVDFSTTVRGKTYAGEVTYSNGEYVASASGLPGANAAGSSVQAAENNLSTRINLVA